MTPGTTTPRAPARAARTSPKPPISAYRGRTSRKRSPSRRPTIQHDLHETQCQCGKTHVAPRPPGVPDSAVSIGPRLRALAVYLLVFQHLPVERCRLLLSDVAGADVSAGFIHSCLAAAASMAAGVVKLIKMLIIASKVVGFDETTLRSGAAGEKKFVHGAFTGKYSLFHLGTRSWRP